ncbi:MAG: imidazolonepropionase [Micropruina sp.]|nr:imidazolonepropionase [Micropruina sp.]
MSVLITEIGGLVTCDDPGPDGVGLRDHHAVVVEPSSDGPRVAWIGPAAKAPAADHRVSLGGACLLPGFVDSHTHLVFAGDRAAEFSARMAGRPYTGGGIATTVDATRAATDSELRAGLQQRLAEAHAQGTTTVEIKSGYGLDLASELRLLRLAREVTSETTFLGAHVVPPGLDRADYLALVTGPMLIAAAPLARWIDVFCEPASPHAFDAEEARAVLLAGRAAGLGLRVHGNQLAPGPGVALAVELGAASVDHCTYLSESDVEALGSAHTVATLLPGVEFSTRHPYPDARRLLAAGATIALASDCNPGTCFTSSMPFVIALAVRELRLTPAQAVVAATRGGATALQRRDIGRIAVGCRADFAVLDAPTIDHLAYRPGMPLVRGLRLPGWPGQARNNVRG